MVKTVCKSPIFFLSELGVLCALARVDPLFGYCRSPEILRKPDKLSTRKVHKNWIRKIAAKNLAQQSRNQMGKSFHHEVFHDLTLVYR
ncbi:MAG: hypothetical protein ACXW4Z_21850, partial [Candidatus Binatia bacterium]